jgi:hypothetical protein
MTADCVESRAIREADLEVAVVSAGALTAAIEDYSAEVKRAGDRYGKEAELLLPLVFGDPDQISVLKVWRAALARAAENARDIASGALRLWVVKYSITADRSAEVAAYTERQASDLVEGHVSDLEEIDEVSPTGPTTGEPGVRRTEIYS